MEFPPCAEKIRVSSHTHMRGILAHPSLMSNRIFDFYLGQFCAVIELYGDRISNRTLLWIVIFNAVALLFYTSDFGPELVNTRVCSRLIGTGVSGKF
jgi:hypothetical protein